jgi:predicted aminopeptidase
MHFFRLGIILLSVLHLSGCYVLQAAQGQLAISTQRKPIAAVIANPTTPVTVQRRLRLIAAARDFASRELGLPDNQSYRSYVDLKREFVVWNVFATDRFSVTPQQWCFPIAGCVVYRGYFHEDAAQSYALGARMKGRDATVGGTAAYSTLGHFDDPVLSTMLRWSDTQIAATLFHELAHQVLYVPNESSFNEAFASVVEEEGARRWLTQLNDPTSLAAWHTARERNVAFTELLLQTRARLADMYKNSPPNMELYFRKQQEFGQLKFAYSQLKESWHGYAGYDAWFNRALNNADLVSAATYQSCVPGLENLLASVNGELPAFYDAAKKLDAAARKRICQ